MKHCISYGNTEATKVIADEWKHNDKSDRAWNTRRQGYTGPARENQAKTIDRLPRTLFRR